MTTHKESGFYSPIKCIIHVISHHRDYNLWDIKIVEILQTDIKSVRSYDKGQLVEWYEDYCFDTRKIRDINNKSEILALVL